MQTLHDGGTPYRDMAVLYRAHYVTRDVEEVLLQEKIPYTIYSGVQFFARAEIKDALSLPAHDRLPGRPVVPAHRRTQPKRNLGDAPHGVSAASRPHERRLLAATTALRAQSWTTRLFRGTKVRQLRLC
ncbi:MAG: 3'-5' exonuclease [Oscillospiraceae bacterium]